MNIRQIYFFVSVALIFLMVYSTTPVNSQQEAYVDKWEPFDIQNSPHVDRFESNYNKFGVSPESQVGTIHEFIAQSPAAARKMVKSHKRFYRV
ncbi:hypothetical protein DAPPUDRAFT_310961 [Daphnia pulex]|uniref:Cathepsin propeptide inhibitor domain-containing protein n=1 Tax=Daphnia pulex TaxID=6669 RepID=E9FW62_DAPPU|nr:hypothetical protein DAPPUDRAFT_310961 [Daphnia pulex]|eukprot:EFX88670.1 hypothetical protein DAPPUDRAFT_310961 [Daphnia pulex]